MIDLRNWKANFLSTLFKIHRFLRKLCDWSETIIIPPFPHSPYLFILYFCLISWYHFPWHYYLYTDVDSTIPSPVSSALSNECRQWAGVSSRAWNESLNKGCLAHGLNQKAKLYSHARAFTNLQVTVKLSDKGNSRTTTSFLVWQVSSRWRQILGSYPSQGQTKPIYNIYSIATKCRIPFNNSLFIS